MSKELIQEDFDRCERCNEEVKISNIMITDNGDAVCPRCYKKTIKEVKRGKEDDYYLL